MKKKAATRKSRGPMVPAITVGFEEAVSKLLKVKPPKKNAGRVKKR